MLERASGIQMESSLVEGRSKTWAWRSLAYGGCPADAKYKCEDMRVKRSHGVEAVVVKTAFPFHGPSPIWGENQNHIDAVLLTIRNPYENYLSWLVDKCALNKDRAMYTFKHYMTEWVDFHAFYRDYALKTCTPLLEARYEEISDVVVRERTLAEMVKHLGFTYAPADVKEAALAYPVGASNITQKLLSAPEVLCFAFDREHVEDDPRAWPEFTHNDEEIRSKASTAQMVQDYNLLAFSQAFRLHFRQACGHFDMKGDLVPAESLLGRTSETNVRTMAEDKDRRDFVSCAELTHVTTASAPAQ